MIVEFHCKTVIIGKWIGTRINAEKEKDKLNESTTSRHNSSVKLGNSIEIPESKEGE